MVNSIKNLLVLFLLYPIGLFAQQKFTISGTVTDKKSGESMIGATVYIQERSGVGTSCNGYGFYSITLVQGTYHIIYSMVGFESDTTVVDLTGDKKLNIKLSDNSLALQEVVVSAIKKDDNLTRVQMGVEKLDMKEIAKVPVIFGERDVLKTIQLLPGIKSAGEGSAGFYVRGGGADQNLILLDEAPVYNSSHLLGFFFLL